MITVDITPVTIDIAPDDALYFCAAFDIALTAIAACEGAKTISVGECDKASIILRELRSTLLRKRGQLLSAAIEKSRNRK